MTTDSDGTTAKRRTKGWTGSSSAQRTRKSRPTKAKAQKKKGNDLTQGIKLNAARTREYQESLLAVAPLRAVIPPFHLAPSHQPPSPEAKDVSE